MPSFTTAADRPNGGAYAAVLAGEEHRQTGRRVLIRTEMRATDAPAPLLVALRAGQPVTVNLFRVPKAFRPDDINPSSPVVVYPNGRIEAA